jgi:MFS superfamily sulfate permease-like transporter
LPSSVLAAVVIAAALSLIEIRGVTHLARTRPSEMMVSLVATGSVALVGVIAGIGIAVGVSLLVFLRCAWAPHSTELVRVDGLKGCHDRLRHPGGIASPGSPWSVSTPPLFFANADTFKLRVLALVGDAGRPVDRVVVTAEPMTDIDAAGAGALAGLLDELEQRRITLAFAELKAGCEKDSIASGWWTGSALSTSTAPWARPSAPTSRRQGSGGPTGRTAWTSLADHAESWAIQPRWLALERPHGHGPLAH